MKMNNITKSVDVVISVNGKPLGGQQGASLTRSASPINITNKINPDWQENLAGTKSWNIACNGSYLVDSASLKALETAFMNSSPIDVTAIVGENKYQGKAIITNFPLSAAFSQGLKYSISLLGTGPLEQM